MFSHIDYFIIILSYILGSIPFGVIITKIFSSKDIRNSGSHNIGATNVTRVAGKKLGATVLILDASKGVAALLITRAFGSESINLELLCAALAVLGHIFPIWLRFKGGKGVATTFAVLIILYYPLGAAIIVIWIITFIVTKVSSVSAITAIISIPLMSLLFPHNMGDNFIYLCLFLSSLILLRHKENIQRLRNGSEKRIK